MKKIYTLLFSVLTCYYANAQQVPAAKQSQTVIITGATAHTGKGDVVENAIIIMENGKISRIGTYDGSTLPGDAELIDAKGKHVYPGLIAPSTRLGLEEIEAVRATLDYREAGSMNPNVRSIISYNTDSRITPTVRSNGVLLALIVPEGGILPGTSSVVKLDGWNWEDAVYKTDVAIHLNWPRMRISSASWMPSAEEQRNRSEQSLREIKTFFDEAKAYNDLLKPDTRNLRFEAMKGVFKGTEKLVIRANYVKEIIAAVQFAKSYGITPVIEGAADSYLITDFLKEQGVPVILSQPHALPNRDEEDVALPYKRAKILQDAGILFCISIDGSWQQRNLPFMAGTAAAYGLSKEEALAAVSLNAAKILGIDASTGSLEQGKDATLVISSGDLLDMRSSLVETAFIKGAKIDLDNKQKALYRKYSEKYGQKE